MRTATPTTARPISSMTRRRRPPAGEASSSDGGNHVAASSVFAAASSRSSRNQRCLDDRRRRPAGGAPVTGRQITSRRSGRGSSPCPRPPRSRGRTSPARPSFRTPPTAPGARSANRRPDRPGCAVHFTSPVFRSRPSNTSLASDVGFHSVSMSSRFTKKSLVSASVFLVKTPCFDGRHVGVQDPHPAHQHRHLRRGERQQLRPVDQQLLGRHRRLWPSGSCGSRPRTARAPRRTRRRSASARRPCAPA